MGLFKKKCSFERSLGVLADKGFTEEYAESLKEELSSAERGQDIAKGKSFLANALLIIGKTGEAYSVFEEINFGKLERRFQGNLVSNMIFAKFIKDDFKAAEELYQKYNAEVLGEHSDASRRSLAIHEHIKGRYENAVEILVKMIGSECRFLDLCLVKSMLRLDMYERAAELSVGFDRYGGELADAAAKLRKKITEGLPPDKKVKYIKSKGTVRFKG